MEIDPVTETYCGHDDQQLKLSQAIEFHLHNLSCEHIELTGKRPSKKQLTQWYARLFRAYSKMEITSNE